jgi:hypothetical protein
MRHIPRWHGDHLRVYEQSVAAHRRLRSEGHTGLCEVPLAAGSLAELMLVHRLLSRQKGAKARRITVKLLSDDWRTGQKFASHKDQVRITDAENNPDVLGELRPPLTGGKPRVHVAAKSEIRELRREGFRRMPSWINYQ